MTEKFEMPMPAPPRPCNACVINRDALRRTRLTGERKGDASVAAFLMGAADALYAGGESFRASLCEAHRRAFGEVEIALKALKEKKETKP